MSTVSLSTERFTPLEIEAFRRDGYVVCRELIPSGCVERMKHVAMRDTEASLGEIEYEADVQYPGAPCSVDAVEGLTIRRLRQAFSRDRVFAELLKEPFLLNRLRQLLGDRIVMPLAHHNCIMTKHPRFSSDTGWHQDTRYWSFEQPELVNVWIALTTESVNNGCLQLLKGTHLVTVAPERLDSRQFLRTDLPRNQSWLDTPVTAELSPGDALFFHARCFHSATRNYGEETKCSAVFTFRTLENSPIPNTHSASLPELLLS